MSAWEQPFPPPSHPSTAAPRTCVTLAHAQCCIPPRPCAHSHRPFLSGRCLPTLGFSQLSPSQCCRYRWALLRLPAAISTQLSQVLSVGHGLVPRQALEFVTHGRAPRWGITPAWREGRSCLSGSGSLGACGAGGLGAGCGGAECCPQPCRRPIAQQSRSSCCGSILAARAWGIVSSTATVCQLQAARRALPGAPIHRGHLGKQRSPAPHNWGLRQHPAPHACSSPWCLFMHLPFMQGRLLRNQQLLMLKALIRRDKTALKIPRRQAPRGRGWRGAGSLRPGVLLGTSQLCVLQVALSRRPVPRNTSSRRAGTERDWLGPARGLLLLEPPAARAAFPCSRRSGDTRGSPGCREPLLLCGARLPSACPGGAGAAQHGDGQRALRLQLPGLPLPLRGRRGR